MARVSEGRSYYLPFDNEGFYWSLEWCYVAVVSVQTTIVWSSFSIVSSKTFL